MNYKNIILNKLIDKYEDSKSLIGQSNRRIILKLKDFKEYDIEEAEIKNLIHDIVENLRNEELLDYSWKKHEKRKYLRRNLVK